MDEPSLIQKLAAEATRHRLLGLHRRGVGARDDHRQRRRAVHHGRPGHDLVRLRHRRGRHGLRARAHLRQPHQPGRHPRPRRHRQVPVVAGACLHRRADRGRDRRRRGHHRRARHGRQRRRPRRRDLFRRGECGPGLFRRVRGYVHSRVHRLRRDTPQGHRRDSPVSPSVWWCSRRSSRLHPPPARRSTRPARSARCWSSSSQAAPSRGVSCRCTWPPNCWPASSPRSPTSRSPAPAPTRRPPLSPCPPSPRPQPEERDNEEAHQRSRRRHQRGTARDGHRASRTAHRPHQPDHLPRRRADPRQGRADLRRRLGPRTVARRLRRAGHARRGMCG